VRDTNAADSSEAMLRAFEIGKPKNFRAAPTGLRYFNVTLPMKMAAL
jgi:hypothetical protein